MIVGPSGVGKSSLINTMRSNKRAFVEEDYCFDPVNYPSLMAITYAVKFSRICSKFFISVSLQSPIQILGSSWFAEQRVGEVSSRSGRGKHTTRHVSLLPISGGGYLADTPGFNQPSLMKVTKQSLPQHFPEVTSKLYFITLNCFRY